MDKMNRARFILIVSLLLSVSGCINYDNETYLNEDLSGRVELCLFLDSRECLKTIAHEVKDEPETKQFMTDLADKATTQFKVNIKEEDFLSMFNAGAIKKKDYRKVEQDGTVHFYFTAEFDDIRKLYEGKKKVVVTEGPDNLITYTEYFEHFKDKKREDRSDGKKSELFKGFKFKYILHMPKDIVSANTDRIDKNTATWELPLDAVMNNKDFFIMVSIKK